MAGQQLAAFPGAGHPAELYPAAGKAVTRTTGDVGPSLPEIVAPILGLAEEREEAISQDLFPPPPQHPPNTMAALMSPEESAATWPAASGHAGTLRSS